MVWPAIIAAGATIAGSLLANRGGDSNDQAAEQFNWNSQLQREFAQNGIRWRVDDAKAAGLHPLYALGGSGASASPINYVGNQGGGSSTNEALGSGLSQFGQDISRAMRAGKTAPERHADEMNRLAMENASLQNDLLRSQIASYNYPGQIGPSMPSGNDGGAGSTAIPGQHDMRSAGPSGLVVVKPQEVTTTIPRHPDTEAGANPSNRWVKTERGWIAMPSKQMNMDDTDITNPEYLSWALRNRVLPTFPGYGQHNPPPDHFLQSDEVGWMFVPGLNEYRPVKRSELDGTKYISPHFKFRRDYAVPPSKEKSWWRRPVF